MKKVKFTNFWVLLPVADPGATWSLNSKMRYYMLHQRGSYQVIIFTNKVEIR